MGNSSEYYSFFEQRGMEQSIRNVMDQVRDLYLSDELPWVVGYSGGKDSTASLQLIWDAISSLPENNRQKPVHIISTDTLVENPIVAIWVGRSLERMHEVIRTKKLPFIPHRLTPKIEDRFWVNLIGKGYPAPRPKFRWCTSRLKINPSNAFINSVVSKHNEAILVLGSRKAESAGRKARMEGYEKGSTRDLLSRNSQLDRVWVYTPIAEWSNDDVWEYVCTYPNPWGHNNSDLLDMYRGATEGGECPLVVDTSTPSCGDSRFGCFVCTLVDKDKSMQAMITNDQEKEWMMPLVRLRNVSLSLDDRDKRDYRRMNGSLMVHNERLVHGPYKQPAREELLEAVLRAQVEVRQKGPAEVRNLQLITIEELEEIRRIWVMEKHEIEDNLPSIYERVFGESYPGVELDDSHLFNEEDMRLLKEICDEEGDEDGVHYQLARECLHLEHQLRTRVNRTGIFQSLNAAIDRAAFPSAETAQEYALSMKEAKDALEESSAIDEIPISQQLPL